MRDELHRLRTENQRLRRLLTEHGIAIPSDVDAVVQPTPARAVPPLPPDEKIRLFRGLFRGREDVYAARWEVRTGEKGIAQNLNETGTRTTQRGEHSG